MIGTMLSGEKFAGRIYKIHAVSHHPQYAIEIFIGGGKGLIFGEEVVGWYPGEFKGV